MTYPPQRPGPYGQQPGQYGQYGQQQPGYQPGPYGPPKKKTGLIIAIVVAVLVLAGGGLTIFLLNQDDEPSNTADRTGQQDPPADEDEPTGGAAPAGGGDPPTGTGEDELAEVAQLYIDAVNAEDEDAATALTCRGNGPGAMYTAHAGERSTTIDSSEVSTNEVSGDPLGIVQVDVGVSQLMPMTLSIKDGAWCVLV